MALTSRSPVQLAAAPSSTPYEVMAASQQAHIDELVQQNRTSEHTIKKLHKALDDEKERGIDVVKRLKAASQEERAEWREGCDSLLGSHRIVHLRTRIEFDKERMQVMKEKEETRKERLLVLQRDYKLTLFQAREAELERRIAQLEETLDEQREQNGESATALLAHHEETVATLRASLTRVDASRKETIAEFNHVQGEKALLQSELSSLRDVHAALTASAATTSTKLERVTLQLEGAKTENAELENVNGELKRTNADLKRQLDKWQNLETKGGAEMEEMRKRRIELEVAVKGLEGRVKELEKSEREGVKALEKERKRAEKLDTRAQSFEEVAEEAQGVAAKAHAEVAEVQAELVSAHTFIKQLQAQLKGNNKVTKEPQKRHKVTREPENGPESAPTSEDESAPPPGSEREVEIAITPVAPLRTRARPRPAYRSAKPSVEAEEPEAAVERAVAGTSRVNGRRKKVNAQEADESEEATVEPGNTSRKEASDVEDEGPPTKTKRKRKAQEGSESEGGANDPKKRKKKPGKKDIDSETTDQPIKRKDKAKAKAKDDSETEQEEPVARKDRGALALESADDEEGRQPDKKGKGKAKPRDESDVDEAPNTTSRAPSRSKPASKSIESSFKRTKPPGRAGSRKPKPAQQGDSDKQEDGENDSDDKTPQPKKKKKRIFAPSQPMSFSWGSLPQGDGGLNIPTELSPVKDSDIVPARSVFGKVTSALQWR